MPESTAPPRRRCAGTNRRGEPCQAAPLKGSDYCAAHDESRPVRFGNHAWSVAAGRRGGRPRLPRPTDVARRLVEENVISVLRPHFRALGYDVELVDDEPRLVPLPDGGAKLHGTHEGEVRVSSHDDLGAMIAAADKLLDRVYGKPRQALEHTGEDGGPIELEAGARWDLSKLSDEELVQLQGLSARAVLPTRER